MSEITKLKDLINPEVMQDMISAKVEKKISVLPYAKVDSTLQGRAGTTVTVPKFTWDGEAEEVAEGEDIPLRNLGTVTENYTIKKVGIGGEITDEAILSGLGDPVGALAGGIAKSILAKCDNDSIAELYTAKTIVNSNAAIGYDSIVDAVDAFGEEDENAEKVMFVAPSQVTTLRKDDDFLDKTKYGGEVMVSGEIGTIAGVRLKPSARVEGVGGVYYNPVIKLETDLELDDEIPALTFYTKRDCNVETQRFSRSRKTEITGDQLYVVSLTNDSKVVLLKTTGAPLKARKPAGNTFKFASYDTVWGLDGYTVKAEITNRATTDTNGTAKIVVAGKAPKMESPTAIGFDSNTKSGVAMFVEVPFATPSTTNTGVYFGMGDNAMTAAGAEDFINLNGVPYLVLGKGLQNNNGDAQQTTATFKLGTSASKYYTYTIDISNLKVEA